MGNGFSLEVLIMSRNVKLEEGSGGGVGGSNVLERGGTLPELNGRPSIRTHMCIICDTRSSIIMRLLICLMRSASIHIP